MTMTNAEAGSYIAGAVHALYLAMPSMASDGNPSGIHVTLYVVVHGPGVQGVELCLSLPELGPDQRVAQTVLFADDHEDAAGAAIDALIQGLGLAE